ncbi:hypothetical protein RSOLAG1IB_01864 [Rhizoctonia solani AG-1 IB]|uniref:Transmembrane protein n=1 Tax=Thanatephorus cucumeris (strain AG1-IB / isolate 7/3/14) TaxID=1108050 RepID=A0A0B7FI46_THACB|nr:hypothetical protein RSOLAG1IB_01864 [Rhizoctonia solani AG-1 IB]
MESPSEPSAAMLNLSALSFLLGITTVTWCITRSLEEHQVWLPKTWTSMPWPRLCLILVLLSSWIYLVLTGVLLFGAPPRHTDMRCTLGTLACILLYGIIKGFIYLCLIERVHAVWSDGRRRWRSPVYRFCFALMMPLGGIAGFMVAQGIHYLRDGYCVLGIKHTAELLFLSYDISLNIFLTLLFVAPLVRSTIRSARLKVIATKAMIATSVGLITTIVNGFVLFSLGGEQIIWVCLGACAVDVVINAVAMYWAMQSPPGPRESVHFSPLSLSNGARIPPPMAKDIAGEFAVAPSKSTFSSIMPDHRQSQMLSYGTTMTTSTSIPVIEIPQPTMRSPRRINLYSGDPSGSRFSLSLSANQTSKSDDSNEADISLQELGLTRDHTRANDSEIYGLKAGNVEPKES